MKKFEVLYRKCNPPSNEIHGLVCSVSPIKIEIFDSDLISSGRFLEEVNFDDIVVTQWNLEEERSSEIQKKKHIADTEKMKTRKELEKIEDQEEKKQKKIKQREILRNLLIEKKKADVRNCKLFFENSYYFFLKRWLLYLIKKFLQMLIGHYLQKRLMKNYLQWKIMMKIMMELKNYKKYIKKKLFINC